MTSITYEQMRDLLDRQAKTLNQKQSGPTAPGVKLPSGELNVFDLALKGAGKSAEAVKSAYDKVAPTIEAGLNTWRDLSKVGAGFNNDVVGMTVAAAGTRMPLQEFAGVVGKNAEQMLGFGGTVTRGAEDFARMSKKMFDEYGTQTDQLRQMGYTNKELNEILVMQGSIQRGAFKDQQSRDKATIESATKLAQEMDEMAKLTGKSREEQMANMKKAQADMQFEAAIRLKTQGMSAEDAKKFEDNARKQYNEAQLRGQGQMFKEIFATGQIMSKEAATQAALNQEQAKATRDQAKASSDSKISAEERERKANEAAAEGRAAAARDMNNTAKLQMMALGDAGGVASQALNKSAEAQIQQVRGLEAVAAANNLDLKTKEGMARAQQIQSEEIKKSQEGKNKEGQSVDGATKAVVNLGARVGDVESALANKMIKPLNEQVSPALGRFADRLMGSKSEALPASATKAGQSVPTYVESELTKGAASEKPSGPIQTAGRAGRAAGESINEALNMVVPPRRQGGSLEATGKMFEDFGKGTMVELHGIETVMRPEDLSKVVGTAVAGAGQAMSQLPMPSDKPKESFAESMSKSVRDGMNTVGLGNIMKQPSAQNIDLAQISKTVNTTVSSMTGGESTTTRTQSDDSKAAEAEMESLRIKFGEDWQKRKEILIEGMSAEDRKFSKVQAAMKADEEAQKIKETYEAKRAELQKRVDDGIKYEFSRKQEAVEETKKTVDEELSIIKQYSSDRIATTELTEDELVKLFEDSGESLDNYFIDMDGNLKTFGESIKDASLDIEDAGLLDSPAMSEAIQAANPVAAPSTGIDIGGITFGPNGMPIVKQTKAAAATIPSKTESKDEETKAKEQQAKALAAAEKAGPDKLNQTKETPKPAATTGKETTLSEVVSALNQVNSRLGQLITVTQDGHRDVAKAAKSNNPNLFKA